MRMLALCFVTGVISGGPALSQEESEKAWCSELDAGLELCLPSIWSEIPNPDSTSPINVYVTDGLLAEVRNQDLPSTSLADAGPLVVSPAQFESVQREAKVTGRVQPYISKAACDFCGRTVSVIADSGGSQTLLMVVPLVLTEVIIKVTSTRTEFTSDDLQNINQLVAGITMNIPLYERTFGNGY